MTTARHVAYSCLRLVHERDAYANLVLPGLLSASRLDERDRGFAAELAYGALRTEGLLDHVLALGSSKPLDQLDPEVLDVLRLGAYQLLRLRVPSHAAVGATVDLAREVVPRATGFVNAVLRRVAERDGDVGAPDRGTDPLGHLSITYAHPRWVVEVFRDALGNDLERTEAALAADDRAAVHLVARSLTRDELLTECSEAGLQAAPTPWSPYGVRLQGGDPGALPSVRDGRAAAQDEGSQLAALVLHRLLGDEPGPLVDACAGPGGKAALLAALRPGAGLLAVELHAHRAELTAASLRTAPPPWAVVRADATDLPVRPGAAAAVLVDAPCSGLGSLRRRPESRWRRTPDDVARLRTLQASLIDSAVAAVRPGGLVAYVVCSPHLGEGREQVLAARERHGVELVDVRPALAGLPDVGDGPWVQLWPHLHGTDAMFIAAVRRSAAITAD